ncbi:MAG TPA: DinB family protein [Planctomycetota bacterium]|nr:DinB family protein [Planctomycetota bacterium]
MSDFCAATELARLREDYVAIERLLQRSDERLARVVPPVSGWSAEQHLAHLALANELVCRNLRSLLKGSGALVIDEGDPPADALAVLESGRFPRGAAQAPRMVRPPEQVRRDYLADWLAGNRLDFDELSARTGEIEAASKRIPHQVLGPLTAARWLRFAAMHTRHHLDIAREVLSACS